MQFALTDLHGKCLPSMLWHLKKCSWLSHVTALGKHIDLDTGWHRCHHVGITLEMPLECCAPCGGNTWNQSSQIFASSITGWIWLVVYLPLWKIWKSNEGHQHRFEQNNKCPSSTVLRRIPQDFGQGHLAMGFRLLAIYNWRCFFVKDAEFTSSKIGTFVQQNMVVGWSWMASTWWFTEAIRGGHKPNRTGLTPLTLLLAGVVTVSTNWAEPPLLFVAVSIRSKWSNVLDSLSFETVPSHCNDPQLGFEFESKHWEK